MTILDRVKYPVAPDQDHGSVPLIDLQRMPLQYEGDKILLLPAWPKDWDVNFRLHAPKNTTIEGKVVAGKVVTGSVSLMMREE